MKRIYAFPLAVLFAAACSEPTATPVTADLNPSFAKPVPPPSGPTVTGSLFTDSYNFDGDIIVAASSAWGTDCEGCIAAAADDNIESVPAAPSNKFLGRFETVGTRALLIVGDAGSEVSIEFDAYIIGSWDGKGRQAQQGTFQANVFSIGWRCENGATGTIFSTTFSNQLTVQQDYPLDISAGGGNKAGLGAEAIDALGYINRPDLSHTPQFRSFGDATYHFAYSLVNPCASVGDGGITFIFSSTNPLAQSPYDESWGIDNVVVKSDI